MDCATGLATLTYKKGRIRTPDSACMVSTLGKFAKELIFKARIFAFYYIKPIC